jgi:quinol monooxygenase YgiN
MLVISGTMTFRKDRLDEAHRQAMLIMSQSATEPGCKTYELSAKLSDPLSFRLFEEWDNPEALTAHFQTPHFQTFSGALPSLLATPPHFLRYEIANVRPLM